MRRLHLVVIAVPLVLAACSGTDSHEEFGAERGITSSEPPSLTVSPPGAPLSVSSTGAITTTVPPAAQPELPALLAAVTKDWNTDWGKRTVDLEDFRVGVILSDPRDVIPPLDTPTFTGVGGAALEDREPGMAVVVGEDARFYPLRILNLHEVVNDAIGGVPVAVTYCPLCNSAVVFDRRVDGEVYTFGTSGLLRNADLVMWDRTTESLWQQITGEAVVGERAGTRLLTLASSIVRFSDFADAYPTGTVLSPDTGIFGAYGVNPYVGYSTAESPNPEFFRGQPDERLPALERVVAVEVDGTHKAYPFSRMAQARVVNDVVGGQPIVVMWGADDTADALDSNRVETGRAIGTGLAFVSAVASGTLTFSVAESGGDLFTDAETGSTWSLLGRALDGPLEGSQLGTATHTNPFWFVWAAFHPDGILFGGPSD